MATGSTHRRQNGPRCVWTDATDSTLIQTLRECKDIGMQSDSGWKPQVWHICADRLKDGVGGEKTAEKVQDHYTNLKASFNAVRKLRNQSGFGWDEGLKMVTASDDVWEAYLAKHDNARKWRRTRFPLYEDILYLVDGIVATGVGAFHAGATQSQAQSQVYGDSQATSQGTAATQPTSDDGVGAADTSGDTLINDDDLTPSSPVCTPAAASSSRKRPPSTPSSPNNGPRSRRKRNAEAASEIAAALQGVAQSLNVVGSPEVRNRAIKMMEEDDDFSEGEEPLVMQLFVKDIAIAQTYIAATKKSRRTAFIRSFLEDTDL